MSPLQGLVFLRPSIPRALPRSASLRAGLGYAMTSPWGFGTGAEHPVSSIRHPHPLAIRHSPLAAPTTWRRQRAMEPQMNADLSAEALAKADERGYRALEA